MTILYAMQCASGAIMYFRNKIISTGLIMLLLIFAVPVAFAGNSCIVCHENTTEKIARTDYQQWMLSRHAAAGITCDNCHGGNFNSSIKEEAHIGVEGQEGANNTFIRNLPETCGKCHVDELKQFKNSAHFEKLDAFDHAPTCYTCHRPHTFSVLNSTEFHDFCTRCHNSDTNIAPLNVSDEAIFAIENEKKFDNEIEIAQNAIMEAKKQDKNVSMAEKDLMTAISIQKNLPKLWHSFNIPHFNEVVDSGIRIAVQAQLDTGLAVAERKSPGFSMILSVIGFIALYLLFKYIN
ncbi:MAG: cytochrome c3 family protein [Candidatus Methanoperedens sp.]|nr:cytochrome c3 family protein [Candidatus Methanoperedens sp.]MCE8428341.1 cytochrome c3 family protein [Candidatus Methanoperedens sp.]